MLSLDVAVALSLLPGRDRFLAAARLWGARRDLVSCPGDSRCPPLDTLLDIVAPGTHDPASLAAWLQRRARSVLKRGAAAGVVPLVFGTPPYPPLLEQIPDPPLVLWVDGVATALASPAVAVVGARAATPAAIELARSIGADLAASGALVVSGLARGVDAAAHEGALAAGLTVAVLGSGPDVIYPPEHAPLARRIAERGAVVSEFPPGIAPHQHHFPLRNRLISGLSAGVVVVEATERSGALSTARCALDQGREVMAVPGPVLPGRNRGAHGLLRDGAALVECGQDVLDVLGWSRLPAQVAAMPGHEDPTGLVPAGEPFTIEELAESSGLDVARLLPALTSLELRGHVRRLAGGRFVRAVGKVVT